MEARPEPPHASHDAAIIHAHDFGGHTVVTQRRRGGGSETSPTLRRGTNNNCLPAARCIRATRFGKIDDLPFALLRAHILIQKITLSHAWLCSMAQVEPLEATG
jgi:hypothetical protein